MWNTKFIGTAWATWRPVSSFFIPIVRQRGLSKYGVALWQDPRQDPCYRETVACKSKRYPSLSQGTPHTQRTSFLQGRLIYSVKEGYINSDTSEIYSNTRKNLGGRGKKQKRKQQASRALRQPTMKPEQNPINTFKKRASRKICPRRDPISRNGRVVTSAERVEARAAERPRGRDDFERPGKHPCGYEPDVDVISIVLHPRSNKGTRRVASDDAPTIVKKPEHRNTLPTPKSELIGENRLERLMHRPRLQGRHETGRGNARAPPREEGAFCETGESRRGLAVSGMCWVSDRHGARTGWSGGGFWQ